MAHSLSSSSPQNKSIKNFRILLSRRSGPRFSNLCYLNLFLPRFKLRSTQEEKTAIAKLGESQLCNLDFCRILIDTRSVTAKVTTIFHDLLLLDSVDIYYMFWVYVRASKLECQKKIALKYYNQLRRGEICVANFIPPCEWSKSGKLFLC